jgi:hypothetical protein
MVDSSRISLIPACRFGGEEHQQAHARKDMQTPTHRTNLFSQGELLNAYA